MQKQVLITPIGAFSEKDKERLFKAGFLVVETVNYSDIRLLSDAEFMDDNDMAFSLIEALATTKAHSDARDKFIQSMYETMKKKNEARIKKQLNK